MKSKTFKYKLNAYQMFPEKLISSISTYYIPWGIDNYYPYFLEDLLNKSALHANIQYNKVDLANSSITWSSDELIPEQESRISKFYYTPNPDEDLEIISRKLILDYVVYGQAAIQVIWSKDRESIAEIYHIPMQKLRYEKPDANGDIKYIYYSDNWRQYRKKLYEPEAIRLFDINDRKDPRQILVIKNIMNAGDYLYTQPSYSATIPAVLTDWHINQFNLNTAQSSLSPDFLLNVPGLITTEEQNEFYDAFENDYMQSTGAKVLVTFTDKENTPSLQIVESSNQDKYTNLIDTVNNQILIGNKVTSPSIVGIKTAGELGSSNEIADAFMLYYYQTIKPIQNEMLKTFNKILKINGIGGSGYVYNLPEIINIFKSQE